MLTSLISFGVGMAVGAAISNNNNYYPYPAWGYHGVYYGGRPYYPVAVPYRPVYTSSWRPATGYYPPANYRWNSTTIKTKAAPYHGYFYRIISAQGAAAPGGARSYVVDGKVTGGFALVACPAEYRTSGVMTFIVNQSGVIYQKDLGDNTADVVKAMTEYNPDKTWTRVK